MKGLMLAPRSLPGLLSGFAARMSPRKMKTNSQPLVGAPEPSQLLERVTQAVYSKMKRPLMVLTELSLDWGTTPVSLVTVPRVSTSHIHS